MQEEKLYIIPESELIDYISMCFHYQEILNTENEPEDFHKFQDKAKEVLIYYERFS